MEADRFGPIDLAETFDDAVDRAIVDQEQAGLDIVSDGEMRRASFVWAFASRMTGLETPGRCGRWVRCRSTCDRCRRPPGRSACRTGWARWRSSSTPVSRTDRPHQGAVARTVRTDDVHPTRRALPRSHAPRRGVRACPQRRDPPPGRGRLHLDPARRAGDAGLRRERPALSRRHRPPVQRVRRGRQRRPSLVARLLRLLPQAPLRQEDVRALLPRPARGASRPVRVRVRHPGDVRDRAMAVLGARPRARRRDHRRADPLLRDARRRGRAGAPLPPSRAGGQAVPHHRLRAAVRPSHPGPSEDHQPGGRQCARSREQLGRRRRKVRTGRGRRPGTR